MKKLMTFFASLALFFAGVPAAALDVGPAVGSKIPALNVVDSTGKPRTLASLAGSNGTVLVFFRSAKWCPYCQAQLMSLKGAPAQFAARGYKLAAISYDPPAVLAKFAQAHDIDYPLLSDTGSKTIDAFGIRDPQYPQGSFAYGVPRPAIFIVAPDGTIRAKLAEEGYKTRPPLAAVLAAIDAAGK